MEVLLSLLNKRGVLSTEETPKKVLILTGTNEMLNKLVIYNYEPILKIT